MVHVFIWFFLFEPYDFKDMNHKSLYVWSTGRNNQKKRIILLRQLQNQNFSLTVIVCNMLFIWWRHQQQLKKKSAMCALSVNVSWLRFMYIYIYLFLDIYMYVYVFRMRFSLIWLLDFISRANSLCVFIYIYF